MGLVMKNYTFIVTRHYKFEIQAENYDDALTKLDDEVSSYGYDDNIVIYENCEHTEEEVKEE